MCALEFTQQTPGSSEYRHGLRQLKAFLQLRAPGILVELATLEDRLENNLRAERLFGSSEDVRNERSQVIYALNTLAYQHTGLTFNALCEVDVPLPGGAGWSQSPDEVASPHSSPSTPFPIKSDSGLVGALQMARRSLDILERQAAMFTTSTIPVHLQIDLEEKRRQVVELEARLGISRAPGA